MDKGQTNNRAKWSIIVKGVDCEIGTNEGLQWIQIVMIQDIIVVMTQWAYVNTWELHKSHSYQDPDADTGTEQCTQIVMTQHIVILMTQLADVCEWKLHESYSCQGPHMTTHGGITPSPRPHHMDPLRENGCERVPHWENGCARFMSNILIVQYVMTAES